MGQASKKSLKPLIILLIVQIFWTDKSILATISYVILLKSNVPNCPSRSPKKISTQTRKNEYGLSWYMP